MYEKQNKSFRDISRSCGPNIDDNDELSYQYNP